MVGVLRDSAAHATGVIQQDAAEPTTVDRRGVRANLRAIQAQGIVGLLTYQAWLNANALAQLFHAHRPKVPANINQYAVGDGLSGKACSPCPENQRDLMLMTEMEEMSNFLGTDRLHHCARNETVEARIGGEGYPLYFANQNPRRINLVLQQIADLAGSELICHSGHDILQHIRLHFVYPTLNKNSDPASFQVKHSIGCEILLFQAIPDIQGRGPQAALSPLQTIDGARPATLNLRRLSGCSAPNIRSRLRCSQNIRSGTPVGSE